MIQEEEVNTILKDLGVTLEVMDRPQMQGTGRASVEVTLVPQTDEPGPHVVSFGLPFPPDALSDDGMIRVTDDEESEIPAFTRPLAHWWIDGKQGSLRSVLVQFEVGFDDTAPKTVVIAWGRPRGLVRTDETPIPDTQVERRAEGFVFHCPKVLALLPPEWLCESLVAWQQVPAAQNIAASWFDRHLVEQYPGSIAHIASEAFEAHLYDRPATYAKIYVRHGKAEYLLAALRAADFYVQQIGPDGFFGLKPGDHKYVYAEGPATMYLLTGDQRYREAVDLGLKSWAKWTRIEYRGEGFWTERHTAFGMAAYLHVYALSGDEALLAKARRYFDGVFALQVNPLDGGAPDGAWAHTAESHGDGNGWATSPWMSALLMDSIWKLWMVTGDERCPASLAMYAKFLERYAVTPDRKALFYMANSPGRGESVHPEKSAHHMEACYMLAMGYYLSGGKDRGLLDTLEGLWPAMMGDNANTPKRKFAWRFRETSMLVWFLQRAGRT